jgi:NDP-sugar pyrophosphorylase family protein
MKAMIFAAGLGSRLKPLTNERPKALVEVCGEPLISNIIKKLKNAGVTDIIVNVHHFADQLTSYLLENDFGVNISISDESRFLLDTGGGLKKAASFFNDGKPFFAYNVDIQSDIDLVKMYNQHVASNALATLAVKNRKSMRFLLFDDNFQLSGWENLASKELRLINHKREELNAYAFSGIQIVDPKVFEMFAEVGKFSIIDVYLRVADKECVKAYLHNDDYWFDLGTFKQLQEAQDFLGKL